MGEQLRYALTWKGQWLAVATWSAAALHIKPRDRFTGWSEEQRRQRLPLVVNNSRLYVLPECHYPNLVSRFMKLMLALFVGFMLSEHTPQAGREFTPFHSGDGGDLCENLVFVRYVHTVTSIIDTEVKKTSLLFRLEEFRLTPCSEPR
ncbi:MAG: Druantia anti-phage system protein DruA [Limisphaerales bacterium]